jgi:transketolase N-terminal domain/subunit
MQVLNVILMLGLGLVSASACANIYGYIDEQGAAHFATEKIDARYQLFMRGKQFDSSEVSPVGPVKPELARYLSQHPNLKKFEPLLKVASNEFAVEPALLKAVMAAESGFNPGAISPKGAIGLMQVMPATAERYGLQGDRNKSIEQKLADPETNIRLGARYLRDLSRRFPNQQQLVLASYNAGEGAVLLHCGTAWGSNVLPSLLAQKLRAAQLFISRFCRSGDKFMAALPENALSASISDADPQETQEWQDALSGVIDQEGAERAHFPDRRPDCQARQQGIDIPYSATTEYVNTIPVDRQPKYPGNADMEIRIHNYIRWNAMAMVVRANKDSNVGGHIASFASAAALYDVGFSWFWHAPSEQHGGDLIFFQGHSVPGVYARAHLLGRLTDEQMDCFRQEVDGKGVSSYPHPWLMPDFWQFPTVSMGLGPIQAIYQARFMKYLDSRGFIKAGDRKVWAFLGDGETDEVESLGAIGMAAREKLDNLIFVINCNLQRLDGPVRGNGKIIQELEGTFRGAGWNVIKLIWGTQWDTLFLRDKKGILKQRMMEAVDGEYQTFKAKDGAYVREHFFNTPELKELVADWTDDQVWALNRGGHDIFKIFSAYKSAVEHKGQPTLILAKTIKGFGMGQAGEAMNISHQQKKLDYDAIKRFRDRFSLPVRDDQIKELPYLKFAEGSPELTYMRQRRMDLGGYLPKRRRSAAPLEVPELAAFDTLLKASGEGREVSTTMAIVRLLNILLKDKRSAATSSRSCPTNHALSAWKACSARSASGTRKARNTFRKTMTS